MFYFALEFNFFFLQNLTVSGWGHTDEQKTTTNILLDVTIPIVSNAQCRKSYDHWIKDTNLCAGKTGKDSCQGDSGGPGVWEDSEKHRKYLLGVVSWGFGCGKQGYPGVYTRVTEYIPWIKSNIGKMSYKGAVKTDVNLSLKIFPSLSLFI